MSHEFSSDEISELVYVGTKDQSGEKPQPKTAFDHVREQLTCLAPNLWQFTDAEVIAARIAHLLNGDPSVPFVADAIQTHFDTFRHQPRPMAINSIIEHAQKRMRLPVPNISSPSSAGSPPAKIRSKADELKERLEGLEKLGTEMIAAHPSHAPEIQAGIASLRSTIMGFGGSLNKQAEGALATNTAKLLRKFPLNGHVEQPKGNGKKKKRDNVY